MNRQRHGLFIQLNTGLIGVIGDLAGTDAPEAGTAFQSTRPLRGGTYFILNRI